jgi:hypothetical protein
LTNCKSINRNTEDGILYNQLINWIGCSVYEHDLPYFWWQVIQWTRSICCAVKNWPVQRLLSKLKASENIFCDNRRCRCVSCYMPIREILQKVHGWPSVEHRDSEDTVTSHGNTAEWNFTQLTALVDWGDARTFFWTVLVGYAYVMYAHMCRLCNYASQYQWSTWMLIFLWMCWAYELHGATMMISRSHSPITRLTNLKTDCQTDGEHYARANLFYDVGAVACENYRRLKKSIAPDIFPKHSTLRQLTKFHCHWRPDRLYGPLQLCLSLSTKKSQLPLGPYQSKITLTATMSVTNYMYYSTLAYLF